MHCLYTPWLAEELEETETEGLPDDVTAVAVTSRSDIIGSHISCWDIIHSATPTRGGSCSE